MSDTEEVVALPPPVVVYCNLCQLPPEYCEFSKDASKCKAWLEENHRELYVQIYAPDEAALAKMSLSDKAVVSTAAVKGSGGVSRKKKSPRQLILKITERSKRKRITTIIGLEQYIISAGKSTSPRAVEAEMKKAAKQFASKFACGSSVAKNAEGKDEIVIQGDVSDSLITILVQQFGVPEEEIVKKEKEKKDDKAGAPGASTK